MTRGAAARVLPLVLILTIPAAAVLTRGAFAGVAVNALVGMAVLVACGLAGGPPLAWLRLRELEPVDRGVFAVALGTVLIALLLLSLGALALLRPWTVLAAVGAAAVLGAWYAPPWKRIPAAWSGVVVLFDGFAGALLLVALFATLTVLLAVSAAPVWDWDSLVYHLSVPGRWLEEGRIFLPPDNPHAAYVGLVHMLYMLPLSVGRTGGVVVVSGLFALLLALALARAVEQESDSPTGRLAIGGLAGTSMVAFVAITPRIDVTLGLFLFLAHWALLQVHRGRSPRWLLAAAVFAGAGLATKLHALVYLLPLTAWVAWLLARRRVPARMVVAGVCLGLAVSGPWLIKNALIIGDPIAPLLSGPEFPSWLMEEPGVAAAADFVDASALSRSRAPIGLRDLVLAPQRLSPEYDAYFYVWSPLLLIGSLLILVRPASWRWALPAVAYVALLLTWSTRTNLRYLIPALPGLSAAAALAVSGIIGWPKGRRWLVNAFLVLSLLPLAVPLREAAVWIRSPEGERRSDSILAAAMEASRRVPPDGLILMLYEGRGMLFERPVLQDNVNLTWPLLVQSGHAGNCLQDLSTPVTHVLINKAGLVYLESRLEEVPEVSNGALDRFIERCLADEILVGSHRLYRLDPRQVPAGAR